ncbi:hypothetical protein GGX14DRAFT_560224 [Mycena pura]|uniref:Uncharacterized protein n=1 Tax=Mycena pura TaxID=153505 RepID=A0AAD6VQE7_9AGAR|nr:hypothetical protein GGX14DRAFT_560224 [Mycena pura]
MDEPDTSAAQRTHGLLVDSGILHELVASPPLHWYTSAIVHVLSMASCSATLPNHGGRAVRGQKVRNDGATNSCERGVTRCQADFHIYQHLEATSSDFILELTTLTTTNWMSTQAPPSSAAQKAKPKLKTAAKPSWKDIIKEYRFFADDKYGLSTAADVSHLNRAITAGYFWPIWTHKAREDAAGCVERERPAGGASNLKAKADAPVKRSPAHVLVLVVVPVVLSPPSPPSPSSPLPLLVTLSLGHIS